ncbi:hypothetical protein TSOC_002458 [Tetrabaena socialis]|uniref:SRCR domain-containing protein n=1 Tax=Tetrabaena socialis TaxID=47790 RepID=A0A2J8AE31_9CHLO|nr:hypothetical protein TSOC_002458 [Tetrabaena socialis]|eukprot:PNH10773.1 hypothetical protein TSOC_002458 [Tetrabaena socialis]
MTAWAGLGPKNGVRLVGGSGPRGRLEVSSVDGWLTDYEDGVLAWRPVCDSGFFDDSMAQAGLVMCELLRYGFGRKHYTTAVAFRELNDTASWSDNPIDYIYCSAPEDDSSLPGIRHRNLLSPLRGTIRTPPNSPYTCSFHKGDCAYTGPMVGIECSGPPTFQNDIQQFGSFFDRQVNLCEGSEDRECPFLARGELLVWAPICAPPDPDLAAMVADLACKQLVDWPYTTLDLVIGEAGTPFRIPAEPEAGAPEGAFRPSSYTAWATVIGGDAVGKMAVQQLDLQVRTSPCEDGRMLSFQCRNFDN